jgi:phosphomannomutase/phosphoglucomutase
LLEYLSRQADIGSTLESLPDSVCTPELQIKMQEGEAHQLIAKLKESAHFEGATEVIDIDGLRVEYPDGFCLIRASNTTPALVLRFEAVRTTSLERIKNQARDALIKTNPNPMQLF